MIEQYNTDLAAADAAAEQRRIAAEIAAEQQRIAAEQSRAAEARVHAERDAIQREEIRGVMSDAVAVAGLARRTIPTNVHASFSDEPLDGWRLALREAEDLVC